jgi:hypothetical protein
MSIYHLTYLVNRKNGSKNLLPDLMKNGINCDLRVLQVGDLLWIAREKTAYGSQFNWWTKESTWIATSY